MGKQETGLNAAPPSKGPDARYNRVALTSSPLPGRRLGAMDQQCGLAMQAAQSFPQQFVQLVGHRHNREMRWVSPTIATSQIGDLDGDTPIG